MEAAQQNAKSVKMGDVYVLTSPGRMSGIYAITNTVNGKQYVGSAVNLQNRLQYHRWELRKQCHHSQKLQRAWNKYRESAFTFKVLLLCEKENLLTYEQIVLDRFDTAKSGYNILCTAGSRLGMKHSDATKVKMSAAQLGKKRSPEICAKMREKMIGYSPSAETRKKIGDASRGRKASAESIQKMMGRIVSEETRAKISISLMGHKLSPETIAKAKATRSKNPFTHTDEAKKNISEKIKALRAKQRMEKLGGKNE